MVRAYPSPQNTAPTAKTLNDGTDISAAPTADRIKANWLARNAPQRRTTVPDMAESTAALRPDVMIVLGWRSEMCRAAVESPALAAVPKLLAFDLTVSKDFAHSIRAAGRQI